MIDQLSLQASQSSLVVMSALASAFVSRMVAFLKILYAYGDPIIVGT